MAGLRHDIETKRQIVLISPSICIIRLCSSFSDSSQRRRSGSSWRPLQTRSEDGASALSEKPRLIHAIGTGKKGIFHRIVPEIGRIGQISGMDSQIIKSRLTGGARSERPKSHYISLSCDSQGRRVAPALVCIRYVIGRSRWRKVN